MKNITNIYYIVIVLLISTLTSCSNYRIPRFDSEQVMQEKCTHLNGLNDFVINKTTIKDMYKSCNKKNIRGEMGYRPNVDNCYDISYSRISKTVKWKRLTIKNYSNLFSNKDIKLDFYNDTLVQISFRYQSDSKQLPEYFTNQYGFGCPVTEDYLSSLTIGYGTAFDLHWSGISAYRKYVNGDIHMVVSGEYWDVIICHKPKFSKMCGEIESAWLSTATPRNDKKTSGHNSMDADDEEYWNSVNREKALKDAGLKDAAQIERRARQNYLKDEGYTSPNGGSQVHYQGSKEQQEHLEEMRRRGW